MTNKRLAKRYGIDTPEYHAARNARNKVKSGILPAYSMDRRRVQVALKWSGGPRTINVPDSNETITLKKRVAYKTVTTFWNTIDIFAQSHE